MRVVIPLHLALRRAGGAIALLAAACGSPTLSTGDTLVVTVNPGTVQSTAGVVDSVCGAPAPTSCTPGLGRQAGVAVRAMNAETGADVPSGVHVTVSATRGWLRPDPGGGTVDCATGDRLAQQTVELASGAATLAWCFGDDGGTADLTAVSGKISASAQLAVPAVPVEVLLWTAATSVAAGETVRLTAYVGDCNGQPVAGKTVRFQVTSAGVLDTSASGVTAATDASGMAQLVGVAKTTPITVRAWLIDLPQLTCTGPEITVTTPPPAAVTPTGMASTGVTR